MNAEFLNKLKEITRRLPEVVKRLPGIAKVEGLQFIHDNFDKEGFEDRPGSVRKWEKRKPEKGKKSKRSGRGILIDKGTMRRSFDTDTQAKQTSVEFTSSMPYTEAHNDGLTAGRPPGFTMPERKMIGDSLALDKRIEDKLDRMVAQVIE
jgi:phage gpG-like protein